MDILNQLSPRKFRLVDDLLAFISIYDDLHRTRAYRTLLLSHRKSIRGAVCVEGGCGLGLFAVELAKHGARKVYAVEHNPLLADLARQRFSHLPRTIAERIELVEEPLQRFRPPEHIDILVHEFYGQLLYDEDLWVLDRLRFRPDMVLPNGGELRAGVLQSLLYRDRIVSPEVVKHLDGVLVSGLFEGESSDLRQPVLRWRFGRGLFPVRHNLQHLKGDLVCLGLVVTHNGRQICEAGKSSNWSFVWTSRGGNRMALRFQRAEAGKECRFQWLP